MSGPPPTPVSTASTAAPPASDGAAAPQITSLSDDLKATFDIETPPGSATAADSNTHFGLGAVQLADELNTMTTMTTMTTISLDADTPTAAAVTAAAAAAEDAPAPPSERVSDASTAATPVAPVLPSSSRPQSSAGRLSEAGSSKALAAAAQDAGELQQPAPQPPATASRVKVLVKDVEKRPDERSRLGAAFASCISCVVRTECSDACPLASSMGEGAGAGSQQQQQQQLAAQEASGSSSPAAVRVCEVRRRFDDFDALSRVLKAHFKGYFLPRLPPSDWLTAGDSFLKTRRVDLQDYLALVSNHPVVQASEELRLFLTTPGDLAACGLWQHMLVRPAPMELLLGLRKGDGGGGGSPTAALSGSSGQAGGGSSGQAGGGGLGVMARMRHSLMSVVQPRAQQVLPPDEQQLQQAKEWLKEMQQHLSACVDVVRGLVAALEGVADSYGALGRSLSGFARFQEALAARQGRYTAAGSAAGERGADLQSLGYGALRQHSLSKQFVLSAGACLVFLPDWQSFTPECIAALQEREDALAAVTLLGDELREKQAAAAKAAAALGPAAAGDRRIVAMYSAVGALQEKLLAAEQSYMLLKERNQAELARIHLQSARDFHAALGKFAVVQAQAAAAAADVWKGVAEQFVQQAEQQQGGP